MSSAAYKVIFHMHLIFMGFLCVICYETISYCNQHNLQLSVLHCTVKLFFFQSAVRDIHIQGL